MSINWGSVADWIMVLVTIITATYIYKTLKSQTKVQKLQAKQNKLELTRYRESIIPKWKLNVERINEPESDAIFNIKYMFILTLLHGQAYNVILELDGYGMIYSDSYKEPVNLCFTNTNEVLRVAANVVGFTENYVDRPVSVGAIGFKYSYTDYLGNKYIQNLGYVLYSNGSEEYNSLEPFFLKKEKTNKS